MDKHAGPMNKTVNTIVDTLGGMSRPTKKPRAFRATDEVYDAAMAEAERRGEYLSEAIMRFLAAYANGGDVSAPSNRR